MNYAQSFQIFFIVDFNTLDVISSVLCISAKSFVYKL